MASITLEVVIDGLKNQDLDDMENVIDKLLSKTYQSKNVSVNENDRDEDEEETEEA